MTDELGIAASWTCDKCKTEVRVIHPTPEGTATAIAASRTDDEIEAFKFNHMRVWHKDDITD